MAAFSANHKRLRVVILGRQTSRLASPMSVIEPGRYPLRYQGTTGRILSPVSAMWRASRRVGRSVYWRGERVGLRAPESVVQTLSLWLRNWNKDHWMKSARRFLPATVSTTGAVLAVAAILASPVFAQSTPDGRFPVTDEQRRMADQVAQAGVPLSALSPSAPASYTVKSGDTLWGISQIFLTSPWRWPELWGMNKEQVRNPHLIYPGQTLNLVKSGDRARLELAGSGVAAGATGGTGADTLPGVPGDAVKLSPRVRDLEGARAAVTSIPANAIEPFLSKPLV